MERQTLKPYFGKHIIFEGIYSGRPRNNEASGWKFEPLINDWLDLRDNEDHSETIETPTFPISPIRFPVYNSLVCDITGVEGFEDIKENHIIVRQDISELDGKLEIRDRVKLWGEVFSYVRDDGSVDYGVDVKRAKKI